MAMLCAHCVKCLYLPNFYIFEGSEESFFFALMYETFFFVNFLYFVTCFIRVKNQTFKPVSCSDYFFSFLGLCNDYVMFTGGNTPGPFEPIDHATCWVTV